MSFYCLWLPKLNKLLQFSFPDSSTTSFSRVGTLPCEGVRFPFGFSMNETLSWVVIFKLLLRKHGVAINLMVFTSVIFNITILTLIA